uniref:AT-rich interactive domain-containing protein 2 n=1 Tax=Anthurium amnicola TaxID=1678845 RepID=A0A1D1YW46_9ARAE
MVSNFTKQSSADHESHLFANKHTWGVNCSGQLTSFVRNPPRHNISEKAPSSDEEVEETFGQSQGEHRPVGDFISKLSVMVEQNLRSRMYECHSEKDPRSISMLMCIGSSTDEDVVRPEHMKGHPPVDEPHQPACKRVRQVDYTDVPFSFLFPHLDDAHELHQPACKRVRRIDYSYQPLSFVLPPLNASHEEPIASDAACEEFRNNRDAVCVNPSGDASACTSSSSWVTCSTSDEESGSDLPVQLSFSPSCIETKHQSSEFIRPEDVYLSIIDYYPRKRVAVGPGHQADVPEWSPPHVKRLSKEMDSSVYFDHVTDEDDNERFMGTCILPMPDFASVNLEEAQIASRSSDCLCLDLGSIGCVKQHIMEVREKLRKTLGESKFTELGFCDMGESIAQKWTEEEELAFHEVVSSNPASMGKNFWDHLPRCFPSKSNKDVVSYYFNVYILRKRAEQNRSYVLDIDSDNDECEESDHGKFDVEDCEGGSIVESPTDQDDINSENSCEEDDFDGEDEDMDACDDCDLDQKLYGVSKGQLDPKSNFVPRVQTTYTNLQDVEDHDIQDESCTSDEGQHDGVNCIDGPAAAAEYEGLGEGHRKLHDEYQNVCSVINPGYVNGPCDTKAWDLSYLSYFSGLEKTVDFLPTCYVIEEVFGKGSCGNKAEDGQDFR